MNVVASFIESSDSLLSLLKKRTQTKYLLARGHLVRMYVLRKYEIIQINYLDAAYISFLGAIIIVTCMMRYSMYASIVTQVKSVV